MCRLQTIKFACGHCDKRVLSPCRNLKEVLDPSGKRVVGCKRDSAPVAFVRRMMRMCPPCQKKKGITQLEELRACLRSERNREMKDILKKHHDQFERMLSEMEKSTLTKPPKLLEVETVHHWINKLHLQEPVNGGSPLRKEIKVRAPRADKSKKEPEFDLLSRMEQLSVQASI